MLGNSSFCKNYSYKKSIVSNLGRMFGILGLVVGS
jgi:hypothetical protein